jgi:hypothetical protein
MSIAGGDKSNGGRQSRTNVAASPGDGRTKDLAGQNDSCRVRPVRNEPGMTSAPCKIVGSVSTLADGPSPQDGADGK